MHEINIGIGERAPWGDFPKVIRNGELGSLQKEPEYRAAKSGDSLAALTLVERLLTEHTTQQIQEIIGNQKPLILPVLAMESSGHNKIPLAMAIVLSHRLGLEVSMISSNVRGLDVLTPGPTIDWRLPLLLKEKLQKIKCI